MDDIPDPDELEWLESNAIPPEDDDFDDYFPDDFEPPPQPPPPQPTLPEPSPPPPPDPPTTKKRPFPEKDDSSSSLPSNEKRSRSAEIPRAEVEEDWLRYEPEKENESVQSTTEEERSVFRFASEIEGGFIPVTGPDGERVYAKMDLVEMNDSSLKKLSMKGYDCGLISEPFSVLMDKMEQETLTKALQASSECLEDSIPHETSVVSEKLWVEKYSPNSFTELLSDEQTNREVLLWLKQWDSCVFGSDIRSTTDDVLSALKRHSSVTHHNKLSDTSFTSKNRRSPFTSTTYTNSSNFSHENSYIEGMHGSQSKKLRAVGPPEHKVLLLCGPPGLGKTTLAHVAAKHCGYRVVEINASDDRASSTIEAKILDVVQTNSIMSDGKPKCLVIDEIDGALGEGKGAVEVIMKMVAADKKSEAGKGDGAIKGSSRKRHKTTLSRPVICICNDLYAPALRPLRQIAKVHVFVQPTINRVVNRLKFICNKEGFRTSSISLTTLAEYTECDIRSCLNTLQFLNKRKEQLNLLEIGSQVVGRKDVSRSAFDVWKEIFQKKKCKRERKSMNNCSTSSSDFDFIHSLISNRGEYELTMDGIHENMLQLHYHDPMMQKTVNCLNTLGVSDYLHQYIMRTQQMSLLAYQPSTAIAIRSLISQIEQPHIEWPKSFYRYRTLFAEKKDLLRCWESKITPFISRHLSIASFVEDSLSPLLYILSPPTLRPISLHLRSEREKGVLTQLVDTMVSYSITYKNRKVEPPPTSLRHEVASEVPTVSLDPPIDEFINFKEYKSDHYGLNLAMKQVLVHEIEKQRFLQRNTEIFQPMNGGNNTASQALSREASGNVQSTSGANAYAENNLTNTKDKLKPGGSSLKSSTDLITSTDNRNGKSNAKVESPRVGKKASAAASNFFDRFRRRGCGDSQDLQSFQKQATLERDSRPLLFKFNEGFTNAVKRPVRIRDLLL